MPLLCMRTKAMGKDEVMSLLDFVVSHKAITTKATNASNNKLKDEAWRNIAEKLSAMAGEVRRPEQLRLKWENLKKAARKRQAIIRQNNLKTGGGKAHIPPDEALDKVASILGATCGGYTVEFGGDAQVIPVLDENPQIEIMDFSPLPEAPQHGVGDPVEVVAEACTPKSFIFSSKRSITKRNKQRQEEALDARIKKDVALAAYLAAKAEKVKLENKKLKLEIEMLEKNNNL